MKLRSANKQKTVQSLAHKHSVLHSPITGPVRIDRYTHGGRVLYSLSLEALSFNDVFVFDVAGEQV